MPVLDKKLLSGHGPYIDFVRSKSRLIYPRGWPAYDLYRKDVVFRMSDDFLGGLCGATKRYVFFDQYEVTQISSPVRLVEFSSMLLTWAVDILKANDAKINKEFRHLSYYRREGVSALEIRADVVETLTYLASLPLQAAVKKEFLIVVGI